MIQRVYDDAIGWADTLLAGRLKGERALGFESALESMTPECRNILHLLIPSVVEQAMFKTLFLLDEEGMELKVNGEVIFYERGELAGWLLNEDG